MDKKKGYVDSFVAFIDILGFKDFVMNNDYNTVDSLFKNINDCFDMFLNKQFFKISKESLNSIKVNIISDSIIISIPKTSKYSFEILLSMVNFLVFDILTKNNLLCRGAISEGEFYSNKNIAFGKAFVEAYKLESSIATYPRIIFTANTLEHYEKISNEKVSENHFLIALDPKDELFYADYISYVLYTMQLFTKYSHEPNYIKPVINLSLKNIEGKLKVETDYRIREKYLYFKRYCKKSIQLVENYIENNKNDIAFV